MDREITSHESSTMTAASDTPTPVNPEPDEIVIEPISHWNYLGLRDLWHYRELLFFFAWRDIKVRYKQTILGAAWALFQPLLMMTVFWLFLGKAAKISTGELSYVLFVLSGLVPWFLFSNTVLAAANSLLDSERLISKVYFPRLAVPFAAAGPALVDFMISLGLLSIVMLYHGIRPGLSLLILPVAICMIVLFALGIGTFLAALNIAYRDFRYVVPFLLQAGLFATPSIYLATQTVSDLPDLVKAVMLLNPMTGLIEFFRAALLGLALPWSQLASAGVVAIVGFFAGCILFRSVEDRFADII